MEPDAAPKRRSVAGGAWSLAARAGRFGSSVVTELIGGVERTRIVVVLASVLALSSADVTTVGASASALRSSLDISNTDIGLLVTATSLVGAVASIPFGSLADRVRRTWLLGGSIVLWGLAMIWSATAGSFGQLLLARVFLGGVTAVAGPVIASLVGDYFPAAERGRIYGFILAGELVGAGFGFSVTGDIAALSWRAAFVILAVPAAVVAWLVLRLPEPERGGQGEGDPHGEQTEAQRLASEKSVEPDPDLVLRVDPRRLGLIAATHYILRIRTNVVLIASSALGYYFLAGVQTFGVEFATKQYRIDQALANLLLLVVGVGAVAGVLLGGAAGDALLRRGVLTARMLVAAVSAGAAAVLFVPAIVRRDATSALPYLTLAALAISAQNPPLDAARLDVVVPRLWGRAEGIRTFLRSAAQALAPLVFGAVSDHVFGGGRTGLKWTFLVMVGPLVASALFLVRGVGTYPRDVATAAASRAAISGREPQR